MKFRKARPFHAITDAISGIDRNVLVVHGPSLLTNRFSFQPWLTG